MYIPFELVLTIIDAAASIYKEKDLMQLRLLNRTINEHILRYIFKDVRDVNERFIDARSLQHLHYSLREQYLYHRIKKHPEEPNLFAHLFLPVYERQLERLGIDDSDTEAKDAVLKKLLRIPMHDGQTSSMVLHQSSTMDGMLTGLKNTFYSAVQTDHTNDAQLYEKELEFDCALASICCAIMDKDPNLEAKLANEYNNSFDRLSVVFNTDLMRFVIRWGDSSVLKLVLEHAPRSRHWSFHDYYVLAAKRKDSREFFMQALLDNCPILRSDTRSPFGGRHILRRAIVRHQHWIFDQVFSWIEIHAKDKMDESDWASVFDTAVQFCDEHAIKRIYPKMHISRNTNVLLHPLILASEPKLSIIEYLLDQGADPNTRKPKDAPPCYLLPPIYLAIEKRLKPFVELLLRRGADPRVGREIQPLLQAAAKSDMEEEVRRMLQETGWNIEAEVETQMSSD